MKKISTYLKNHLCGVSIISKEYGYAEWSVNKILLMYMMSVLPWLVLHFVYFIVH